MPIVNFFHKFCNISVDASTRQRAASNADIDYQRGIRCETLRGRVTRGARPRTASCRGSASQIASISKLNLRAYASRMR